MADAMDYFKSEKDKHVKAAQDVIAKAQKEMRNLTDEERDEVKAHTTAATEFNSKIKAEMENKKMADDVAELGRALESEPESAAPGSPGTVGDAFVKSGGFQGLKNRGTPGNRGRFSIGPIDVGYPNQFGATAGIVTEGVNATLLVPQRIPGIVGPVEPPLRLADLFGQAQATGNTVVLARETTTHNAAAIVAEGALKPASDIQFTVESVTLDKIATVIKVSTEMLEDETAMATYLNGRLGVFVRQREEYKLITDLFAQAGQNAVAADVGGTNTFDAIAAGIRAVREFGGYEPDAVVMSALEAAKLVTAKTGQGIYYSGGPYVSGSNSPWGLRMVVSQRIGDGIIVVGAFADGGTVWRKTGGVSVEATNSNEDDFLHNLVAIRAEERMKLFIYRPDAFVTVDIAS